VWYFNNITILTYEKIQTNVYIFTVQRAMTWVNYEKSISWSTWYSW